MEVLTPVVVVEQQLAGSAETPLYSTTQCCRRDILVFILNKTQHSKRREVSLRVSSSSGSK